MNKLKKFQGSVVLQQAHFMFKTKAETSGGKIVTNVEQSQ